MAWGDTTNRYAGVAAVAATMLVALAGCAAVATKDVIADSDKYLAENFTPQQLAPPVRARLERGRKLADRFKRMHITYLVSADDEGRKQEVMSSVDLKNLGNGYVQSRAEMSKNNIPYRVNLGLSFGGIFSLKRQTVFLERSNALQPVDTKEIRQFDRGVVHPVKGTIYTATAVTGTAVQLGGFKTEVTSCVADEPQPATSIHPALTGDAVPLDCTVTGENKAVVTRLRYAWLSDYGVALHQEVADSRVKSVYVVQDITVMR